MHSVFSQKVQLVQVWLAGGGVRAAHRVSGTRTRTPPDGPAPTPTHHTLRDLVPPQATVQLDHPEVAKV